MTDRDFFAGDDIGNRDYPLPSCGACLNIAKRRGISIGDRVKEGLIEGFSHAGGVTHALVFTEDGFVLPIPLDDVQGRVFV